MTFDCEEEQSLVYNTLTIIQDVDVHFPLNDLQGI